MLHVIFTNIPLVRISHLPTLWCKSHRESCPFLGKTPCSEQGTQTYIHPALCTIYSSNAKNLCSPFFEPVGHAYCSPEKLGLSTMHFLQSPQLHNLLMMHISLHQVSRSSLGQAVYKLKKKMCSGRAGTGYIPLKLSFGLKKNGKYTAFSIAVPPFSRAGISKL